MGMVDDTNATFTIERGDARFSDDGLTIIGKGSVGCRLEWDDKPSTAGTAINEIRIEGPTVRHNGPDTTWSQDGEKQEMILNPSLCLLKIE